MITDVIKVRFENCSQHALLWDLMGRVKNYVIKGIVHPKMKILSSFTHSQVVPNLYECLCSAEHKGRYSEECGKQSSSGAPLTSIVFFFLLWKSMVPQKQPGYKLSSKYLPLCSAEQRHSYRFRTTWGRVNDDRIFIFGWTIPLSVILCVFEQDEKSRRRVLLKEHLALSI